MSSKKSKQSSDLSLLQASNSVFQSAIQFETDVEVAKKCLQIAENLTDSKFGFIGELNSVGRFDTIALSDPGWDVCRLPDSDKTNLITNMEVRGIWGKVIKEEKSLIVNDPPNHPDRIGIPDGHPPLTAFLGVPLFQGGKIFGMISLGNKQGGYSKADQQNMEGLSVPFAEVLRQKRLEMDLANKANEILELSTPIMSIWKGVVVAPLIGTLDSQRTHQFMERLLETIVETSSPVALIDITGVPYVDTQTAQHMIETINAVKLLGSQAILTGVSPSIAQTLVHLGIEMTGISTRPSLAAGLQVALAKLDYQIIERTNE